MKADKFIKLLKLRGEGLEDTFYINLAKIPFIFSSLFNRKPTLGEFLLKDVVARNSYGFFFCRRGEDDLGLVSDFFESEIIKMLKLKEGDIAIDCGAHVGKYTVLFSKLVGENGKVISVEADPENFKILKRNISLNRCENVIALNCAVWDVDKTLKLNLSKIAGHHSLKKDWGKGFVKVSGRRLDDISKEFSIKKIKWLKIDVEGSEVETLLGAKKLLENNKVLNIVFEVSNSENYNRCLNIFSKFGYEIQKTPIWNYFIAMSSKN